MRLQRLAKDPDSYAVGGCQTMYLAENGMFTVQASRSTPAPWERGEPAAR